MHVDLFTLYLIIIGTLLASACLTYWEHLDPSRPQYVAAAVGGRLRHARGGLLHRFRTARPCPVLGLALSNLVILSGYLLVLNAVAALNGLYAPARWACWASWR